MKEILLTFSVVAIIVLSACQKDEILTDSNVRLEFSMDTLRFDTVFTEIGSATRILKVYNRNDQRISISSIGLENGAASKFRVNIDGIAAAQATDIEIPAEDSIYIFVEVTIDPDAPLSISPFVIHENIVFETNGNIQEVVLEAWGQNANYFPSRFSGGNIALLTCNMSEFAFDDPKPYVIFGILAVDSCKLTLPPGTRIYVHGGLQGSGEQLYNDGILYFGKNGTLNIQGTLDNPVIIEGDRLEEEFDDVQGQWGGIRLSEGSKDHYIENAIIKNSIVGVRVDSAACLIIKNSQIANVAGAGLLGVHADIYGENCLINDCGSFGVQLEYGGNYEFNYCTMASYGVDAEALRLSNALCLDQLCREFRPNPINAKFNNCIVMGSKSDELTFFNRSDEIGFDYDFKNCVVRIDDLDEPEAFPDFFEHCIGCINYTQGDALFVDVDEADYHLDTLSIADKNAFVIDEIQFDLEGTMRDAVSPDIGALERVD